VDESNFRTVLKSPVDAEWNCDSELECEFHGRSRGAYFERRLSRAVRLLFGVCWYTVFNGLDPGAGLVVHNLSSWNL
jgi:hypothetical protein